MGMVERLRLNRLGFPMEPDITADRMRSTVSAPEFDS